MIVTGSGILFPTLSHPISIRIALTNGGYSYLWQIQVELWDRLCP